MKGLIENGPDSIAVRPVIETRVKHLRPVLQRADRLRHALAVRRIRFQEMADLAILAYLLFHYYFIAHAGLAGVVDLLFT